MTWAPARPQFTHEAGAVELFPSSPGFRKPSPQTQQGTKGATALI